LTENNQQYYLELLADDLRFVVERHQGGFQIYDVSGDYIRKFYYLNQEAFEDNILYRDGRNPQYRTIQNKFRAWYRNLFEEDELEEFFLEFLFGVGDQIEHIIFDERMRGNAAENREGAEVLEQSLEEIGDEIIEIARRNDYDIGTVIEPRPFRYHDNQVVTTTRGIFLVSDDNKIKEVFNHQFKIMHYTIDVNRRNKVIYTIKIGDDQNGILYRNMAISEILDRLRLEGKIRRHGVYGRDVMEKYIEYLTEKNAIEYFEPCYILGWENGWFLPWNETEKQITIIQHGDTEENVYQNLKNNYERYTPSQKNIIRKRMQRFIESSQMDEHKFNAIIGWSMAAPFKLYFLEKELFALLFLQGKRNVGKSRTNDFFSIHFFKALKQHLTNDDLNNYTHLGQALISCTFPMVFQEIQEIKNSGTIDVLKDTVTGRPPFTRYKNNGELRNKKEMTAPILLDTNDIPDLIQDAPQNSKLFYIKFERSEKIRVNTPEKLFKSEIWKYLYGKLKKKHLFSLIYDFTEDWNDHDITRRISKIKLERRNEFERLNQIDSRLKWTYLSVLFGIELFEDVFEVDLNKDGILKLVLTSRSHLPQEILEKFVCYCSEAREYQYTKEKYNNDLQYASPDRYVHNPLPTFPPYLKHGISTNSKGRSFYTTYNRQDFKRGYGVDMSLPKLYELLRDALPDKSLLDYGRSHIPHLRATKHAIGIKEEFFELYDNPVEKDSDEIENNNDDLNNQEMFNGRISDSSVFNPTRTPRIIVRRQTNYDYKENEATRQSIINKYGEKNTRVDEFFEEWMKFEEVEQFEDLIIISIDIFTLSKEEIADKLHEWALKKSSEGWLEYEPNYSDGKGLLKII
jgi:hypothetical protein